MKKAKHVSESPVIARSAAFPPAPPASADVRTLGILIILVCAVVAFAHWPVLDAKAINLDDEQYLFDNPVLQNPSWSSVGIVFREVLRSSTVEGYYEPLTLVSLMLDVAAGGRIDHLWPFHVTSLTLHLLNTTLIIVLLYMLCGRPWVAAAVGLLFGVHPLTVEPVAWVWERKTLLAAFFAIWCMIIYVRYTLRPTLPVYIGTLLMFLLALLAKPTVTPLPMLLLLLDFWPLSRLGRKAIVEKIPFFLIAAAFAVITIISTARNALVTLPGEHQLTQLPLKICYLIALYMAKIVWPVNLSSIYVLPEPMSLSNPSVLIGLAATCTIASLLALSLRWTRAPLVAGLFFVIGISPTLGVVSYSWVTASDKYVYLPMIGLLACLAWLLNHLAGLPEAARPVWRHATAGAGVLAIAALLLVGTRHHLEQWQTTEKLESYMLGLAPESPFANYCYANMLKDKGKLTEAISYYTKAIRLKPDYPDAYNNRGIAHRGIQDFAQALQDVTMAMTLRPHDAQAYSNRGNVFSDMQDYGRALQDYAKAIELKPNMAETYSNRGNVYAIMRDRERAIADYTKAIELKPSYWDAYCNRGKLYANAGDFRRALEDYSRAIQLKPDHADAYYSRGNIFSNIREHSLAVADYTRAIALKPDFASAFYNRGNAYASLRDDGKAVQDYTRAIELRPDHAEAYFNRGNARRRMHDYDRAIADYTRVIELKPEYVKAYYNRGNTFNETGNFGRALPDYTKAVELKPDYAEAYYNRAVSRFSLKQFDQAWADIRRCEELAGKVDPKFIESLSRASSRPN